MGVQAPRSAHRCRRASDPGNPRLPVCTPCPHSAREPGPENGSAAVRGTEAQAQDNGKWGWGGEEHSGTQGGHRQRGSMLPPLRGREQLLSARQGPTSLLATTQEKQGNPCFYENLPF